MEGKTVLVTGATSGVGFATALELARRGATVTLHGGNAARGEEARTAAARVAAAAAEPTLLLADLSSPRSTSTTRRESGHPTSSACMSRRSPRTCSSRSSSHGALLACSPAYATVTGSFFQEGRERRPKPITRDVAVAQRLWALSGELTGVCRLTLVGHLRHDRGAPVTSTSTVTSSAAAAAAMRSAARGSARSTAA